MCGCQWIYLNFPATSRRQIHVFNFNETWQDWGKSLSVAWLQVTSEFTSNNSFFTNWKEWIKSDKIALLLLSYMWYSVTEMWVHKYHRNHGVWIYVDTFLSLLESPLVMPQKWKHSAAHAMGSILITTHLPIEILEILWFGSEWKPINHDISKVEQHKPHLLHLF